MQSTDADAQGAKLGYLVRWSTKLQTGNYRGKEQDEAFPQLLRERGFVPVLFKEGAKSGRDLSKRAVALRLLGAIEAGEIDGLAGWDVKRITRDETGEDAGHMIRLCMEKRALIVTAEREYRVWLRRDLRDFKREALDAGENLLDIRDTFWQGIVGRAKREPFFVGVAPVGYTTRLIEVAPSEPGEKTRIKREPMRDEGQAEMMAALGEALDECQTVHEVARRMNRAKLYPVARRGENRGRPVEWGNDRVEAVIANPLYVGSWTFGRHADAQSAIWQLPNVSHGAIQPGHTTNGRVIAVQVRPELAWYDEARQRAWQRKYAQSGAGPKRRTREYERGLRGVLLCNACGRPMVAAGETGYACWARSQPADIRFCATPQTLREHCALAALWAELPRLLDEWAGWQRDLRNLIAERGEGPSKRVELEQLKARLDGSVAQWMGGTSAGRVPDAVQAMWLTWQADIDQREAELRNMDEAELTDGWRQRLYNAIVADPTKAREKMTVAQQCAFFRDCVADVQVQPSGWAAQRTFQVRTRRNLLTADDVAGGSAARCPAYLSSLLA
jgi:hypothetical protein